MSNIAKGNVEILVHTTAPSLGRDDVRYRALAQSYLDFQPAKRRKLDIPPVSPPEILNTRPPSQVHKAASYSTQEERSSEASWQPDSDGPESMSQARQLDDFDRQDITELLQSPELSFLSVMDNRASPAFRGQVTRRSTGSQNAAEPPGSEVPDSQPDFNPAIAAFAEISSPTRILEVFIQNNLDSSQSTSQSGPTPSSERHYNPGSLEKLYSSERASTSSPKSTRQERSQANSSLEVGISNEDRSSSQSLPRNRDVDGSPILSDSGGNSTTPSQRNSSNRYEEKESLEVAVGSLQASHSSPELPPSQGIPESIPIAEPVSTSDPVSSFDVLATPSSPSPVKAVPSPPQRVLRSKSPNAPIIIQDTSPSKKRKLASIIETQISSSAPPTLALFSHPQPPRPNKKPRLEPTSSPIKPTTNDLTSSKTPTPQSSRPKKDWSQHLEIYPPPPQTSSGELTPETLITPKLHSVTVRWPLSKLYQPLSQSRPLNPMERGYWCLNLRTWPAEVRISSWNFLGELVGSEVVGWGVWCVRDEGEMGLRVYCWGCVVGHVWLVLKAASLNKVCRTGACWVGGNGEVVVRMN